MPYTDVTKQKQAQHESYLRNKAKVKEATKQTREKRKQIIRDLKENSPCMDCGVNYPYFVMEFDHRDPTIKINSVALLLQRASIKSVLEEIEKCDLVCSNCHRFRTQNRY